MRTAAACDVPVALKRIQRRLARWRQTRCGRDRIPEGLWGLAVQAVGTYGLNKTARALGLDYYSLKKRGEAAGGSARRGRPKASRGAQFVELASGSAEWVPARSSGVPECLLEFERAGGAQLRVQLRSLTVADLVVLGRSFWSADT